MDHDDTRSPFEEDPTSPPPRSPTQALLHHWLVEYNPFYLLSATLVLAGIWLLSREAAKLATVSGALSVGVLAEVYALSLIGGAAFLTRIGQRRSAVMLGLIAAFYQADATLHVETCTFLGTAGLVASAAWLVLFVVKLGALALALQLRPSRSAMAVPLLAAVGLAFIPHALRLMPSSARTVLVCSWVFATFATALWSDRHITSSVGWDERGRRAMRGTWAMWGALLLGHVGYWAPTYHVQLAALLPAALLLAVPFVNKEQQVYGFTGGALVIAWVVAPHHFGVVAVMTALTLAVCARRGSVVTVAPPAHDDPHPYRGLNMSFVVAPPRRFMADEQAPPRLWLLALASLYLAVWIPDASDVLVAVHGVAAVSVTVVLSLGLAVHHQKPTLTTPLVPLVLHALGQREMLPPLPETALTWGLAATSAGFVVLFGALAASWYVGRLAASRPRATGHAGDAGASVRSSRTR